MAKRPFIVSNDEQAEVVPTPTPQELEDDTQRLLRKFDRKHGKDYPRLLAALRATEEAPDNA